MNTNIISVLAEHAKKNGDDNVIVTIPVDKKIDGDWRIDVRFKSEHHNPNFKLVKILLY